MRIVFKMAVVSACFTLCWGASAQEYKRITTGDDFAEQVVGKKLFFKGRDFFTVRRNGRLAGNFGGSRVAGTWAWEGQFWCRKLTKPAQNIDCQKWESNGTDFRVTRAKGKGQSFIYTLSK